MAKQPGRTFLIRIGDGETPTEAFALLCGLTSKTFTLNNSDIDVTTANCADPGGPMWRETLAGIKSVSISGNGYFKNEASEATLRTAAMSADGRANFEIVVPAFGTFAGNFVIQSLDFGGEQEDGVTYALSLASSGPVTFTAVGGS